MMKLVPNTNTDRRGRDRMVIGFTTTTIAISSYHHLSCEFESRSWRGVLDKTLCDKVCDNTIYIKWKLSIAISEMDIS
jgi:hypothetical protein